jgi:hypothetical protein
VETLLGPVLLAAPPGPVRRAQLVAREGRIEAVVSEGPRDTAAGRLRLAVPA